MIDISDIAPHNNTVRKSIAAACVPPSACIPLSAANGDACSCVSPLVSVGERVSEGQQIASAGSAAVPVFSSIPGVVRDIRPALAPDGVFRLSAVIELSGAFSYLGKKKSPVDWRRLSQEQLCASLEKHGAVNTFDHAELLASQIKQLPPGSVHILCVRLFDRDPSVALDAFLSQTCAAYVLEGAAVIAAAAGITRILFVFASEKQRSAMQASIAEQCAGMDTYSLSVPKHRYPQGGRQEIQRLVKKQNAVSFCSELSAADLFIDSFTAYAAYTAVVSDMPCIDSIVHVSGDAVRSSGVFRVKTGTPIYNLIEECGGFSKNPAQIIVNGRILGTAVSDLSVPVTNTVKSIQCVSKKERPMHIQECIRCGSCRRACPQSLAPDVLYEHAYRAAPCDSVYLKTVVLCTSCMLCNASCPVRLPLYQAICCLKEQVHEK